MTWLLAWPYLWVVALMLLLIGFGLLRQGRRKEGARERQHGLPRPEHEKLPYFALPWDGDASFGGKDSVASESSRETVSPEEATPPVSDEMFAPSPLASAFNTLSTRGGSCAQRPMGDALRMQEPLIRAAVNSGDGHGASFKIAGVVEWPLWARLQHDSGAGVTVAYPVTAAPSSSQPAFADSAHMAAASASVNDPGVSATELVDALEDYLSHRPHDRQTQLQVGLSLWEDAQKESDESTRAGLLEGSIRILRESTNADPNPDFELTLARACLTRALIGPEVDVYLLSEAEDILRRVIAADAPNRIHALWELQKALQVIPHDWTRDRIVERLTEAEALLVEGVTLSHSAAAWRGALLGAQLRKLLAFTSNSNERRLPLRGLHAQWLPAMRQEMAADVLGPWIELLCAIAEPLSGQAAEDRYAEAQAALRRMHATDDSPSYAQAWTDVALGRTRLLRGAAKAQLMAEAEAILQPHAESNDRMRLQACKVALAQAQSADEASARNSYLRVVELGHTLTAVPTYTREALRYVLTALLALGEQKERRVYAKCLDIMTGPDDGESLLLMAECHLQAGDHREGCLHAEMAWRAGAVLSANVVGLWQSAYAQWSAQAEDSVALARNRNCLRMVASAQKDRIQRVR